MTQERKDRCERCKYLGTTPAQGFVPLDPPIDGHSFAMGHVDTPACHRRSPNAGIGDMWPRVKLDDWCGDFEEKEEP